MAKLIMPLSYTVDLDQRTRRTDIAEPLVQGDNQAHQIIMTARRGSAAADLSGATCQCYVVLPNKQTVLVSATVSGNVVTASLNTACYAVPGRVSILMRLSVSGAIVTPLYLNGSVVTGNTDAYLDPGDIVPSLEELLAQIGAMEAATAAANTTTGKANTAASAANTAATAANSAANTAVSAANTAVSIANTAATNAVTIATTAGANAVTIANTAATNANTAAAGANAATAKWNTVNVDVDMLPPEATPSGSVTQTATSTTIHLDLPQGRITNATLYMDDANQSVRMRVPDLPEVGITYAMDPDTTELYQRVHGY